MERDGIPLEELLRLCDELRPSDGSRPDVLKIAQDSGLAVTIIYREDTRSTHGRLDEARGHPRACLFRRGRDGAERVLRANEEHLLTARERFSLAHEIGHWIAWRRLGIRPALPSGEAYWEQEKVANSFAAHLLVPMQAMERWSGPLAIGAISPAELRVVATRFGVSMEVAAHRLCEVRSDVGFLKLSEAVRSRDERPVLRVGFACSGGALVLPNIHSHLDDDFLMRLLRRGWSGRDINDRVQFLTGPHELAWMTLPGRPPHAAWISLAPVNVEQLPLSVSLP